MAVTLTGAGGFFTRLGKLIFSQQTINTARLTTIPDEIEDYADQLESTTIEIKATADGIGNASTQLASAMAPVIAQHRTWAQSLIIQMVEDDNPQDQKTLTASLKELIRQMDSSSDTVDANVVSATPTADGSNNGDGVMVTSAKRADGLTNEMMFAEDIIAECTSDASEGQETFQFRGEQAVADKLSEQWPAGSGVNQSSTAVDAGGGNNLLSNGGFETEDDVDNFPDSWILQTGQIGTTIALTDPEVQTVVISGTPTSGSYRLIYTNADSEVVYTDYLAYNASESAVQSALRAIPGLGNVDVAQTGTTPNFTNTITFNGTDGGNLTELTSWENFDTGSIAHNTTTQGDANVYKGSRALEITGNGSETTEIWQEVSLEPLTQYAVNLFAKTDGTVPAGECKVELYDGSAVINDEQGTANALTIDVTSLTSSYAAQNAAFRTPRVMPAKVYLRIRLSTAISNTEKFYIDHIALAAMTELYQGGPNVLLFSGATPWKAGDTANRGDFFTVAVANDYGGDFQTWGDRNFDMREKGLLFPSAGGGGETIDESTLIA